MITTRAVLLMPPFLRAPPQPRVRRAARRRSSSDRSVAESTIVAGSSGAQSKLLPRPVSCIHRSKGLCCRTCAESNREAPDRAPHAGDHGDRCGRLSRDGDRRGGNDQPGDRGASKILEPMLERHRGRLIKLMGDGSLSVFDSVVDAVNCAAEIQRTAAKRNKAVKGSDRLATADWHQRRRRGAARQ